MSTLTGDGSLSIEPAVRRWRAVRGLCVVVAIVAGAELRVMLVGLLVDAPRSVHQGTWGAVLVGSLVVLALS
ncbi:hypothetical protein CZ771_14220 [Actinomycetales bacterium JB111]|nr:hypothetical protein CZ771_14220 [Actinomycetales bacterium JB111]